jgi:hypothetical protein
MANLGSAISGALSGATAGGVASGGNPYAIAAGGLLGAGASVMGANEVEATQKKAAKEIQANQAAMIAKLEAIGVPTEEAMKIASEQYPMPEELKPSLMSDVNLDPRLQETRMAALAKLQNISDAGGLDAQSQAALDEAMGQVAIQERGQREAIDMSMQRRGMSGSGIEAVQQQMNAQNAANQSRSAGLQQAASAQQRALAALTQGANLAGNMSAEDVAIQQRKAEAQDAVNKFNTVGRNATTMGNVDLANKDKLQNTQNLKDIFNMNVSKVSGQVPVVNQTNATIAGVGAQNATNAAAQTQGIIGAGTAAANAYGQSVKDDKAEKAAAAKAAQDQANYGAWLKTQQK